MTGTDLRELRRTTGLSQERYAAVVEMTGASISRLERRTQPIAGHRARDIAALTAAWLQAREEA